MRDFEYETLWEGLDKVTDSAKRVDAELRILRAARECFAPGISFAIPTFGEVRAETMICVDRAMRVLQRQGVETALVMNAQTLLPDCREQIAEECARGPKLDTVLWVDSDIVFEPDAVWQLYQKTREFYRYEPPLQPARDFAVALQWIDDLQEISFWVWGCPYMTRGRAPRLCIHPLPDDQGNLWIEEMEGLWSKVEVAGIGLGLAFVPTVAMALLSTPLFERPWRGAGYLGEDLAFCERIRTAGGQVFAEFGVPAPGHLVVTEKTLSSYHGQVKAQFHAQDAKREAWGDRSEERSPDSLPRPAVPEVRE